MKHREFTPEQKAAWEQHRAERKARFEQIQKACDGKANGQTVNVQVGDKTLEGTCNLRFEPKRPQPPVNAPALQLFKQNNSKIITKGAYRRLCLYITIYDFDYLYHINIIKSIYTQSTYII